MKPRDSRRPLADREVLVPVDFSPEARTAALEAGEIIRAGNGAITLLFVQHIASVHTLDFAYTEAPEKTMAVRQAAEDALDTLARQLGVERERIRTEVALGDTVSMILEYAALHDLVVMGTHGRTGVRRFLLGSVAERVVRAAPCSVLVVRSPPAPS